MSQLVLPTAVGADALPLSFEILPSAARTSAPADTDFDVLGATGLIVVINPTAHTSTPAVTVTIKGVTRDGVEWTILTGAAITDLTSSPQVLQVSPHITAATNVAANALVPEIIRISIAHGDSDSLTYSVEGILVP